MRYDFDRIVSEKIIVVCSSPEEQRDFVEDMYKNRPELVWWNARQDMWKYIRKDEPCYRFSPKDKSLKTGDEECYKASYYKDYTFVPLVELLLENDFVPSSKSIHALIG